MPTKERLDTQTAEETFDTFTAIGICEGFLEAKTEEDSIRAWQFLVDNGLCWQLQGRFGRIATNMLNQGIIKPKKQ
jgi:hypothetical protein